MLSSWPFCRTVWYSIKIKHYAHGHSGHEFVSNYDLPHELQIIECIWLLFSLKVSIGFLSVFIYYHDHYCLHSVKISLLVITSSQRSLRYVITTLKPDENDGHSAGSRIPLYSNVLTSIQALTRIHTHYKIWDDIFYRFQSLGIW